MNMITLVLIGVGAGLAVFGAIWWRLGDNKALAFGLMAAGCWLEVLYAAIAHLPVAAVEYGALAAYWTWRWWKHRRGGRKKRTAKALGAKSRARIQALVRRMTPSPIPSPAGGRP